MSKLFISHSSQDDAFVRGLSRRSASSRRRSVDRFARAAPRRSALAGHRRKPSSEASAFAVVVSPASLQSRWVGKELRHALDVQKQRGQGASSRSSRFRWTARSSACSKNSSTSEPLYIRVSSDAGGSRRGGESRSSSPLGKRLPADVPVVAAAEGRAAGGARARAHRLEVSRAGRRAPRLGSRPARL